MLQLTVNGRHLEYPIGQQEGGIECRVNEGDVKFHLYSYDSTRENPNSIYRQI